MQHREKDNWFFQWLRKKGSLHNCTTLLFLVFKLQGGSSAHIKLWFFTLHGIGFAMDMQPDYWGLHLWVSYVFKCSLSLARESKCLVERGDCLFFELRYDNEVFIWSRGGKSSFILRMRIILSPLHLVLFGVQCCYYVCLDLDLWMQWEKCKACTVEPMCKRAI